MSGDDSLKDLIGAQAVVEASVTPEMTAKAIGSGDLPVLGTPAILALVERAAVAALATTGSIPDSMTTVGTSVKLVHLDPTPVGEKVRATASIDRILGRRYHFIFSVWDSRGEVAGGVHVRALVEREAFEARAASRTKPRRAPSAPASPGKKPASSS